MGARGRRSFTTLGRPEDEALPKSPPLREEYLGPQRASAGERVESGEAKARRLLRDAKHGKVRSAPTARGVQKRSGKREVTKQEG